MPTLMEILTQNLNIWLQNMNANASQLHSILNSSLSEFLSIILSALAAILPPA